MMVSNLDAEANQLLRPATLADARAALAADPALRPIGGGTAVVPSLRAGSTPGRWMTTASIGELDRISVDETGRLRIGAAVTLRRIETDTRVRAGWPLLVRAVSTVAGPAIRHAATIGGSLALGADSPDPATALMALDATVQVLDESGLAIADLGVTTPAARGPFIEAVYVPPAPDGGWDYQRSTVRGASDRPFVVVAASATHTTVRVVAGVGQQRPVELSSTGHAVADRLPWDEALEADVESLRIDDDGRGSGRYRRRVLHALAKRAIAGAIPTGSGA